ncbi:MAG: hypothetical protein IT537_04435 [Hyphomicrobiales bacterium]|nr:hypothetical protein [Hyphomicrobiales bacterium]
MKKTLTAFVAAGAVAVSLAGSVNDASAQRGAVAAGVAAGVVGGVLLGTAIANSQPAYVAPAPVYGPPRTCVVQQQVWSNRMQAWVVRPVRVAC